jgi:hypothetical protein
LGELPLRASFMLIFSDSKLPTEANTQAVAQGLRLPGDVEQGTVRENQHEQREDSGATLIEKVESLRQHFKLQEALPSIGVVDRAAEELGIAGQLEGKVLVEKVDACLKALDAPEPLAHHTVMSQVWKYQSRQDAVCTVGAVVFLHLLGAFSTLMAIAFGCEPYRAPYAVPRHGYLHVLKPQTCIPGEVSKFE